MAITKIAVAGTVYLPSGQPAAGGTITLELTQAGSITVDGNQQVIGSRFPVPIGLDGTVSFDLVPNNLVSIPIGAVYYRAIFAVGGVQWTEFWDLSSSGPNPIDLGEIVRVDTGSIGGVGPNKLTLAGIGSAWPTASLNYKDQVWVRRSPGEATEVGVCVDDGLDPPSWRWNVFAIGGS